MLILVQLEDSVIAAYVELVVKLNETAFQPLFRKFCDWAFGDEARRSSSFAIKITFSWHFRYDEKDHILTFLFCVARSLQGMSDGYLENCSIS